MVRVAGPAVRGASPAGRAGAPWGNAVVVSLLGAVSSVLVARALGDPSTLPGPLGGVDVHGSAAPLLVEAARALLVAALGLAWASGRSRRAAEDDRGLLVLLYCVGTTVLLTGWWILWSGELGWDRAGRVIALVAGSLLALVLRRPDPVRGGRGRAQG